MSDYGYVRVSSIDQNEERQMVDMRKLGIPEAVRQGFQPTEIQEIVIQTKER